MYRKPVSATTLPRSIWATVTAGLRCPGPPKATEVKTPIITAKPQPVAMTIQPAFWAFDLCSKTAATTPSPKRTNIIVPRVSASMFMHP